MKAEVTVFGSAEGVTLRAHTVKANLPEVLKLAAEVLRMPALGRDELERTVSEAVAEAESRKHEPDYVASLELARNMKPYPKGHVRAVPTPDEAIADLKALKPDDVAAFHKDFYGAAAGEMAVIGDFDIHQTKAGIQDLFGAWKARRAFARILDHNFGVAPVNKVFETPDKANASFRAGLEITMRDSGPDYPAMLMADYMIGGGAFHSRLADRIRQSDGISYTVGSRLWVSPFDAVGYWSAYAICNPVNMGKLENAFREELARALKDGFTADEIEAAKTSWVQGQAQDRSQDKNLAEALADQLHTGRTMAFQANMEDRVKALTNDRILAALRKHLDPARMSMVKAGEFKGNPNPTPNR